MPLVITLGYPGYILDIRSHFFGREGESRHFLWRKVFRERDADQQIIDRLHKIQVEHEKKDEKKAEKRDMKKSVGELEEEARGGIEKQAKNVENHKAAGSSKKVGQKQVQDDDDADDDDDDE